MKVADKAAVTELSAFYTSSGKTKKTLVEERGFYSLSYRYYGKVLFKTENESFISDASSITFMPQNIKYETEIIEDTRMAVLHFKLARDIDFRNAAVLRVSDKSVPALFEKLIQSFRVDEPIDFGCMACFYELLATLEGVARHARADRIPQKIAEARKEMLRRFSDPLFSIGALAERLGVSTAYLRREFSRTYGKSPVTFLKELRISNAQTLLQSEYLTIAEIAAQSGFSGPSYFIQVFHRATGDSPDRYRRRLYGK